MRFLRFDYFYLNLVHWVSIELRERRGSGIDRKKTARQKKDVKSETARLKDRASERHRDRDT